MLETDFYQPPASETQLSLLDRISKIPAIGVILAASAAILFATGSLFVKLIDSVDPVEVVLFR